MDVKAKRSQSSKSQPSTDLKLSLMENAYNFVNQSLRHYRKSRRNMHEWPFALLHVTQSIELMLKYRLSKIHPIFIFEDVDHPKRTVSIEQALGRLEILGIIVGEKEKVSIRKASDFRNRVVHHEFELNRFELKNTYAQLFEFAHFFHHKHFKRELHAQIAKDNWSVEAGLMAYFKQNFLVYNGLQMHKDMPKEILNAQKITFFTADGQNYQRVKYGDEPHSTEMDSEFAELPCHDCLVVKGQYHAAFCDFERCPKCHHQVLDCGCF